MSSLVSCKLGDVIEFGNGKSRPQTHGSIPVYGGNGILGYCANANYAGETLIIGRVGAYCGATYYENKEVWVSDNALAAKPKAGNNAKYLYYFLKFMDLNQHAGGSSHPLVTQTLLNSLDVEVIKNEQEQKSIAAILSGLDDKIELLHHQNKTLEAMAEALFRQWFVEGAGEDWKTVKVGDFVKTNESTASSSYSHQFIEYLDTSSLTEGKIEEVQLLNFKEAPSRARRIVKHNDILISTVRPNQKHYGIIKNPKENLVVSTGFCVLTCKSIDPYFIYILLTTNEMTEYMHSIAEGSTSTYPSLKPSDIEKIEFLLPPKKLLNEFAALAASNWNKIELNYRQITTLEKLRDDLLPKLMSGELRVENA